jgi:hypothetical protein
MDQVLVDIGSVLLLHIVAPSITENLKLNYNKVVKTEKILLGSLSSDSGFGWRYIFIPFVRPYEN